MVAVEETLGNYIVLEKLAEGGVGAVFKARHRDTGQVVALKVIPPALAADPVLLKRFEQEFLAVARLDHPNVVRGLSFGQDGSVHYLVMEYVDGESLGQRLTRKGRLAEAEAIRVVVQVARALQAAHGLGLIHRDVKPDNILLTLDGQAKLTDFGIVKETGAELMLTLSRTALGTPQFMAPEQFEDAKAADVRSEIYSLGATLYAAVTGETPFPARGNLAVLRKKRGNELTPPRELVPELSKRVDQAIRRAVRADPAQRPQSCLEFINDLVKPAHRRPHAPREGSPHAEGEAYGIHKASGSAQWMPSPGVVGAVKRAEIRAAPRRRAKGTARYRSSASSSSGPAKAILINLSEGGVLMLVQERFEVGDLIEVELSGPASLFGRDRYRLLRKAEVRWIEGSLYYQIGCRWTERLSFAELKRFI